MEKDQNDSNENGPASSGGFSATKFWGLLFVVLLLVYGKVLWPQVFGRMWNEGVPFIAAVTDLSAHAIAFSLLVACVAIGFVWVLLKEKLHG